MGLLDIFKKKEQPQDIDLFTLMSRYHEHIVRFIIMQQQGNNAPISAYERNDGSVAGFLFLIGKDKSYNLSADDAVSKMEERFERQLAAGEINSYVILFHADYDEQTSGAIVVQYHFSTGQKGKIACPYKIDGEQISYHNFTGFSTEQTNLIFGIELAKEKNYFEDLEEIVAPSITNPAGLTIAKANTYDLSNTWAAIFGFESYRQPGGSNALREYFVKGILNEPVYENNGLKVSEVEFDDVKFRVLSGNGMAKTIIPVIKTDYFIDVENKFISEWENVDNLEAVITGAGRDTFGITYFATDYAENRELYLKQKKHMVKITGIVYVMDIYTNDDEGELKYSPEYTAYFPNKDLAQCGCFDFIGEVEDLKETGLLEDGALKGYIMKVRLVNNPDVKDFFTIDMYVVPENMRFEGLRKGMKVTGMFQMLGELVK